MQPTVNTAADFGVKTEFRVTMKSEKTKYLLSVATDPAGDQVYIHVDLAGLEVLEKSIAFIKDKLQKGECEHDHFHSLAWAGEELTESMLVQEADAGCNQVHHVKIYGWSKEWRNKHGLWVF